MLSRAAASATDRPIGPAVSWAAEIGTMPDRAPPAAEPEREPDGWRSSANGLAVWPPSVDQPLVPWVERKFAHSDRLALATMTAPAWRSRDTMNASRSWPP